MGLKLDWRGFLFVGLREDKDSRSVTKEQAGEP